MWCGVDGEPAFKARHDYNELCMELMRRKEVFESYNLHGNGD